MLSSVRLSPRSLVELRDREVASAEETRLARLFGLELTAMPSAVAGSAALWGLFGLAAWRAARLSPAAAAATGLAGALLHWTADTAHHLGHAWAAQRTGHPMTGIRYWAVIATSVYPPDEPPLPAAVHVRRALGGPAASIVLGTLAGLAALALRRARPGPQGQPATFLLSLFALDSLVVLGLGALVPLEFDDGATLQEWLPRL